MYQPVNSEENQSKTNHENYALPGFFFVIVVIYGFVIQGSVWPHHMAHMIWTLLYGPYRMCTWYGSPNTTCYII